MAKTRVIDTNVLMVASAADDGSPLHPNASPVEEIKLRRTVLDWLIAFEQDKQLHVVLDYGWNIFNEYKGQNRRDKLTDQDFGLMVILSKIDRQETHFVHLKMDGNGHAELPETLIFHVKDPDDRKMVAAVLAAQIDGTECKLTNACDTDWLDCADALRAHGIDVEHLIRDWLWHKWKAKNSKK